MEGKLFVVKGIPRVEFQFGVLNLKDRLVKDSTVVRDGILISLSFNWYAEILLAESKFYVPSTERELYQYSVIFQNVLISIGNWSSSEFLTFHGTASL